MRYTVLLPFLTLLIVSGCNGGSDFPVEPVITYVSIEPKTIVQQQDSVNITFHFTDGDGDVGLSRIVGEDTFTSVIYVTDTRYKLFPTFPQSFFVQEFPVGQDLMPSIKKKTILGKMTVQLSGLQTLRFGDFDRTTFQVQMYDRANHASNIIETDSITITK